MERGDTKTQLELVSFSGGETAFNNNNREAIARRHRNEGHCSAARSSFFGVVHSARRIFFFFHRTLQYIIKNQIKKCKCAQRKKKQQHIHNRKQGKKTVSKGLDHVCVCV